MIKILFFARLREQLKCPSIELNLVEELTIKDIIDKLLIQHPDWQPYLSSESLLMAVNQNMANETSAVKSGDEVAFFPPVTDG